MNQSQPLPFPLLSTAHDVDPASPIFWLGCSLLLVAMSLTAVLVAALPVIQELARAARSAEKFFDTLSQELPPTMASLRSTGVEIGELKRDVDRGVKSAINVVEQVDRSLVATKQQVGQVQTAAQGFWVGSKAAWRAFRSYPQAEPASQMSASSDAEIMIAETEQSVPPSLQPPSI